MTAGDWRVRSEDGRGEGWSIPWERLAHGIADGTWKEADQVRGPAESSWTLIGDHPHVSEFLPRTPLFRTTEAEEADVDMTPMIDVVFQLLIFFMIAATFIVQKTLSLPKPEPSDDGVTIEQLEQNNVMVKLSKDGHVTVNGTNVSMEALPDALGEAASKLGTSEVVLDADDDVENQLVVQVMDAAGAAEIERVHFVSRTGSPVSP